MMYPLSSGFIQERGTHHKCNGSFLMAYRNETDQCPSVVLFSRAFTTESFFVLQMSSSALEALFLSSRAEQTKQY